MIYGVRILRYQGQKRPKDQLEKIHFQGHLVVDKGQAFIFSPVDNKVMFMMEPAQVRKILREGILVVGREPGINAGELLPQAWWCTAPPPHVPTPYSHGGISAPVPPPGESPGAG